MAKVELNVSMDKKLSLNYQSVGLQASIRVVKETEDIEEDLTTLKATIETWLDNQILMSAQSLPRLSQKAKKLADDIPM